MSPHRGTSLFYYLSRLSYLFVSYKSRVSLSFLFSHRGTSRGRPRSDTSSRPWPTGLPEKRPALPSRTCRWPGASSGHRQGTPGTELCGTCRKKKKRRNKREDQRGPRERRNINININSNSNRSKLRKKMQQQLSNIRRCWGGGGFISLEALKMSPIPSAAPVNTTTGADYTQQQPSMPSKRKNEQAGRQAGSRYQATKQPRA